MLNLKKENLDTLVTNHLGLTDKPSDIEVFQALVTKIKSLKKTVKIALVGKYVSLRDAYLSVSEALNHAGYFHDAEVIIDWIDSSKLKSDNIEETLKNADGIVIPGGFGKRGIEGKILAIKYARENNVPLLGLCLGMQLSVIEFARNVLNLGNANSTEFDSETPYNIIDYMPDQYQGIYMGGTLRLGLYECQLQKNTLAHSAYNQDVIYERHRHRYEFNNEFKEIFESKGMIFSGINPQTNLVEIVELKSHPFFVAVQFHPEFLSRPDKPHPLFKKFIEKSLKS
jgi:CTP synthase